MFGFLQRGLAAVFAVAVFGFAIFLVMQLQPVSAGGWALRVGLLIGAGLGALLVYRALSPPRRDGEGLPERHGAGIAMGVGVSGRRRRDDPDDDLELD
ncbi:hypothetical protein DDZ18_02380 [Marinicauda salina]|uniref:Uncharacterized protein n=1 Tax=Marinicauda salina TaxID=2135793 RepID=A0A2U2BWS7_9PROT|nr:hypothetical protein [Marinicauda salina]PWE18473.1 hypothetical protein DDZ18_02380 [Marinicauda salina]